MGWEWLEDEWPLEERPRILQDKEKVKSLSMGVLAKMQKNYLLKKRIEAKENARAKGAGKAARDTPPKTILFKEAQDDGKEVLHDARWLRLPISEPTKWFPKTPKIRTEIYKALPLKFCGADNSIANKTLERSHDRTDALLLKHYLSENCNIASRPKQEIRKLNDEGQLVNSVEDAWEAVTSVTAAREAYMNYACVSFFLFPFDPTPMLMQRVMTRYNWISAVSDNPEQRTKLIEAFFNATLQQNAFRAANDECVLSFQEQIDLLKNQLRSARVSTEPVLGRDPTISKSNKASRANQSANNPPQKGGRNSGGYAPTVYKTADNKLCCYKWNRLDGTDCNNTKSDIGCEVNGTKYAHRCSAPAPNGQGVCGKPHRRRDHK